MCYFMFFFGVVNEIFNGLLMNVFMSYSMS